MADNIQEAKEKENQSLDDFFDAQSAPVVPKTVRVHISDNACVACEG